ncbi:MAG: YfhO family protein, partial [Clostridiales bacterium]|nr:YfhO family protein [Clostridiales bacterium]
MQKISAFLLVLFMLFETAGMAPRTAGGLTPYTNGLSDSDYQDQALQLTELKPIVEQNNCGYRVTAEELAAKPENLGIEYEYEMTAFLGQKSVGHFDSSLNRKYARFMKQLGLLVNFNYAYYSYAYVSKPLDAFFSVGNVVTTSDYGNATLVSSDASDKIYKSYANSNALPIGFAVDKGAMNFQFYMLERLKGAKDYFGFQNNWYKSMFPQNFNDGVYQGIYHVQDEDLTVYNGVKMPEGKTDVKIDGVFANDDPLGDESLERSLEGKNTYYRLSPNAPITVTIKHTAEYSGEQYFCLASSVLQSENKTFIDGKQLAYVYPLSYFTNILRLGYYEAGDEIELTITSSYEAFSYLDMYFATVNAEIFDKQFETLDLNKVKVDKFDNGIASFTTDLGENELLLTTIPYEKGWTCYVDGKETEISVYQDALIAVDPGTGTHKVELRFVAPGLKIGIAVSAVGIILLAVFLFVDRSKKSAGGKVAEEEKKEVKTEAEKKVFDDDKKTGEEEAKVDAEPAAKNANE